MGHIYGFTGTRAGMTPYQRLRLLKILEHDRNVGEFHHGDCIGADAEAHDIAWAIRDIAIIIHPPSDDKHRAFKTNALVLVTRPYLERNHDIVDACDVLIAAPKEVIEQRRSGTWATVRYARKIGKPVVILAPEPEED